VTPLEYALEYARRQWRVFPCWWARPQGTACACGVKTCANVGKHPIGNLAPRGCLDATDDVEKIRAWWKTYPSANVAIATGNGLVVVDIDPRHGGDESFDQLKERLGPLPDTVEAITGGGGRHLYLALPSGRVARNSAGVLAPGIDVRGEGGYVLAAPSSHVSGATYGWEAMSDPTEGVALAELSGAWLDAVAPPERPAAHRGAVAASATVGEGGRNAALFSHGRSLLAKGIEGAALTQVLLTINDSLCSPPLPTEEVEKIAKSVGRKPPGLSPEYHERREAARKAPAPVTPTAPEPSEEPATIFVGPDEERVNDEGVRALAAHAASYQRGGALVHVVCDQSPLRGVIRPKSAPRIVPMAPATLREYLAASAVWLAPGERGPKRVPVPKTAVAAIHARGQWTGVRTLEAVVDCPVMRPDGSIIEATGYDAPTGILYAPSGEFPPVPQAPSLADAKTAVAKLFDLFVDFPFRTEAHRSAAIAAVLTPLASYAFRGAKPLFLFDANVAGAGKGKCVSLVSEIVQGRPMAVMAPTADEEEQRKRILAIALSGEALTLIDNVDGSLGGASLDAAITGQEVSDRILGATAMVRMPLVTTWFATGNNVSLRGDMQRRVVHVRLESETAHPEDRKGFKHADVEGFAREHRAELVVAALTAMRAFKLHRPVLNLPPWGSFAGWSDLVRGTLVWCGYADPGETRVELREEADVTTIALTALLSGWGDVTKKHAGYATVGQLLRVLEVDEREAGTSRSLGYLGVREALSELCAGSPGRLPSARALGNVLRRHKGRIVRCADGSLAALQLARKGAEGAVWTVRRSDSSESSDSSISPPHEGGIRIYKGESESLDSPESLPHWGEVIDVC